MKNIEEIKPTNNILIYKESIIKKIESGLYDKDKLIAWIQHFPTVKNEQILEQNTKYQPIFNKVGDVYMHKVFKHPCVLLKNKKDYWICGLLTTENTCPNILEKCESRFFNDSYFTNVLFTEKKLSGKFMNVYDNNKQLKNIFKKLNKLMK